MVVYPSHSSPEFYFNKTVSKYNLAAALEQRLRAYDKGSEGDGRTPCIYLAVPDNADDACDKHISVCVFICVGECLCVVSSVKVFRGHLLIYNYITFKFEESCKTRKTCIEMNEQA